MQGGHDRDRAIDRALRRTLRTPMNPPGATPLGDCIDGETLAAWAEGRLRSGEAALVEQHLSDCTRCQHLLAAFARTAPAAAETRPGWRGWRFRWLVPIATAATVAGIWLISPQQAVPPVEPPAATASLRAPEAPPAPELADTESLKRSTQSPASAPVPEARSNSQAFGRTESPTVAKREESDRRETPGARPPSTASPARATESVDVQVTTPKPAQDAVGTLRETVTVQPETGVVDAQTSRTRAFKETAQVAAGAAPAQPQAAPRSAAAPLAAQLRSVALIEIVSPAPANRWRIVNAEPRRVERTITGGSQWETVNIPADVIYTGGSSPAPTVCWIVGQGGAVFLTTDGLRFMRLRFPESVNLISVTATDDRRATVMSADGRSFRTEDQGLTWMRSGPP